MSIKNQAEEQFVALKAEVKKQLEELDKKLRIMERNASKEKAAATSTNASKFKRKSVSKAHEFGKLLEEGTMNNSTSSLEDSGPEKP